MIPRMAEERDGSSDSGRRGRARLPANHTDRGTSPARSPSFFRRLCDGIRDFARNIRRRRQSRRSILVPLSHFTEVRASRHSDRRSATLAQEFRGRRHYDPNSMRLRSNNYLALERQSLDFEPFSPSFEQSASDLDFFYSYPLRPPTAFVNDEDEEQIVAEKAESSSGILKDLEEERSSTGLVRFRQISPIRIAKAINPRQREFNQRVSRTHVFPIICPGSHRESLHQQMKLARSVCNSVTLIPEIVNEEPDVDKKPPPPVLKRNCYLENGDSALNKAVEAEPDDIFPGEKEGGISIYGEQGNYLHAYFPLNGDLPMPLTHSPKFKPHKRKINSNRIGRKRIRAELNRAQMRELKNEKNQINIERWKQRRIVGMLKKKLREENNLHAIIINGDYEAKFHHIDNFCPDEAGPNYVGKYFDKDDKCLVAIKVYGHGIASSEPLKRLQCKISGMTEINALVQIESSNVVQLISYFEQGSKIHSVLEPCESSLRAELNKVGKCMHWTTAQEIIRQVATGLAHCHSLGCLHRDVCPESILANADGVIKLANFEKAVFLTNNAKEALCPGPGRIAYAAPELLSRSLEFGLKADVWSLGCTFAEVLRGTPLWDYSTETEQLTQIQNTFGATIHKESNTITYNRDRRGVKNLAEMFPRVSEDVISFLSKCLELESKNRSSCEGLLHHIFLNYSRETLEVVKERSSITTPAKGLWMSRPHSAPNTQVQTQLTAILLDSNEKCQISEHIQNMVESVAENQSPNQSKVLQEGNCRDRQARNKKLLLEVQDSSSASAILDLGHRLRLSPRSSFESGTGSDSSCSSQIPSILKKGNGRTHKNKGSKVRFAEVAAAPEKFQIPKLTPATEKTSSTTLPKKAVKLPKSRNYVISPRTSMNEIILAIRRSSSWSTVDIFTFQLKRAYKRSPRTFAAHLGKLVDVLLAQISLSKSKIAGPNVRILRAIYDFTPPEILEPEAEKIIPKILGKLGGPLFIESECCDILQHIVDYTNPALAASAFIKFGLSQKYGMSRAKTAKYVCEIIKKLNMKEDIGADLKQRRLTSQIFEIMFRFAQDGHTNTRDYGKEMMRILMLHPQFWNLYAAHVPIDQNARMNSLLDEIHRTNPMPEDFRRQNRP